MYKVLVATSYFYPDTGGVANHTYNLYKRLAQRKDFKISVVTSGKKSSSLFLNGMEVKRLPFWFKISNTPINPLWFFQIKKIIKEFEPDIVSVHTPVPIMPDIAALTSGNIPLIVKYHHGGSMTKGKPITDFFIKFYENTLFKLFLKKTKVVISSSEYASKNYLKEYKNKLVTITPGVDLEKFVPGKFAPKDRILFVANLNKSERYKGLKYLLFAIPHIIKKFPKALLVIVGDGNDADYYRQLTKKLKVNRNVIFKGKLTGRKLLTEYQKCTLVVLPSLFESCPNVLLEAMACAKVVCGSNTGGIPNLIDDERNGLLFSANDPDDIARAVITILANPRIAKKMGREGYKRVKHDYSWDIKVEMTRKVIEEVLKKI